MFPPVLFNMVMGETIRTEVQNGAILKTLVPEDNIVIWELTDGTSETKFHRAS